MASSVPTKIFIQIDSTAEQQENIKNTQKSSRSFAVLQKTGTVDKENLVGRQTFMTKEQSSKKASESELIQVTGIKRRVPSTNTTSTSSQTSPTPKTVTETITKDDLTSENVTEKYWEVLAEKRRVALEESLVENQELYERIATLETELKESKTMLTEARHLVEVLTEMLEENEEDKDATIPSDTAMENENT